MTILQYLYAAVAIILAAAGITGVVWWHQDIVSNCEAKMKAADQSAIVKQLAQDNVQKAKDLDDAVTAISQLQADKQSLAVALAAARSSVSTIRLCGTAHSPSPLPSSSSVAAEPQPTSPGPSGLSGVPKGDRTGDFGTELQDLAFAGAIAASAYRSTFQWANQQSVN